MGWGKRKREKKKERGKIDSKGRGSSSVLKKGEKKGGRGHEPFFFLSSTIARGEKGKRGGKGDYSYSDIADEFVKRKREGWGRDNYSLYPELLYRESGERKLEKGKESFSNRSCED